MIMTGLETEPPGRVTARGHIYIVYFLSSSLLSTEMECGHLRPDLRSEVGSEVPNIKKVPPTTNTNILLPSPVRMCCLKGQGTLLKSWVFKNPTSSSIQVSHHRVLSPVLLNEINFEDLLVSFPSSESRFLTHFMQISCRDKPVLYCRVIN